jgi:hypothetical protein
MHSLFFMCMHAAYSTQLIVFYIITLKISGKECKSDSSLCNFCRFSTYSSRYLHMFPSALCSPMSSPYSSIRVWNAVIPKLYLGREVPATVQ